MRRLGREVNNRESSTRRRSRRLPELTDTCPSFPYRVIDDHTFGGDIVGSQKRSRAADELEEAHRAPPEQAIVVYPHRQLVKKDMAIRCQQHGQQRFAVSLKYRLALLYRSLCMSCSLYFDWVVEPEITPVLGTILLEPADVIKREANQLI